jgi:hypothetical protein
MAKYEILDGQGAVLTTIVADQDFVLTHFPGRYRRVPETEQDRVAQIDALVLEYDGLVQSHLDTVARSWGYGEKTRPDASAILHAITYAEEPAVPKFQAEGRALRAWRSSVWAACYAMLDEVKSGLRAIPTAQEVIAVLPAPPAREGA